MKKCEKKNRNTIIWQQYTSIAIFDASYIKYHKIFLLEFSENSF